jgi:hypothetical protein
MESNTYIKERLKEHFETEDKNHQKLIDQLRLQIFSMETGQHDAYVLAKKLPREYMIDLFAYFDEDCIRTPGIEHWIYLETLSMIYYLRTNKGMAWAEIRKKLKLSNDDPLYKTPAMSKKVEEIDNYIQMRLRKALPSLDLSEVENVIKR